jgi:AraC-like DNA-binding protein
MTWLLSDYLHDLDFRTGAWCFVEAGRNSGFHVPRSDHIFFHAVLEGSCRLTAAASQVLECKAGDIAIVLSGEAHKIRFGLGKTTPVVEALAAASPKDVPANAQVGKGPFEKRLLSGRVELAWPIGVRPSRLPAMLLVNAREAGLDLRQYVEEARFRGGSEILTTLARLLFIRAIRDNPICWRQFELKLDDPITRAMVLLEKYPFSPWKVETLAAEVGMGRSNFATKFTHRFGTTPIDALADQRMKHAAELLSGTKFKVSEVSERIGYRSEAAFIGRFKSHFGVTPSEWRRLNARPAEGRAAGQSTSLPIWRQLSPNLARRQA